MAGAFRADGGVRKRVVMGHCPWVSGKCLGATLWAQGTPHPHVRSPPGMCAHEGVIQKAMGPEDARLLLQEGCCCSRDWDRAGAHHDAASPHGKRPGPGIRFGFWSGGRGRSITVWSPTWGRGA